LTDIANEGDHPLQPQQQECKLLAGHLGKCRLRPPSPAPENDSICAICLDALPHCRTTPALHFEQKPLGIGAREARPEVFPCGHAFHETCAGPWLRRSHSCPLCRSPIHSVTTQTGVREPSRRRLGPMSMSMLSFGTGRRSQTLHRHAISRSAATGDFSDTLAASAFPASEGGTTSSVLFASPQPVGQPSARRAWYPEIIEAGEEAVPRNRLPPLLQTASSTG
jgi:hypothetical protein